MVFKEKEVIELENGKKFIVVDTLKEANTWYYYLCEVNEEETKVQKNFRVITTVFENGNYFIKNIKGDLLVSIEKIFKEKLQID